MEGELRHQRARLHVHVTPRARADAIAGWEGDVLRVRVTAPPVDGRANAALEALVARALGVARSRVTVVAGAKARLKLIEIDGLRPEQVREALAPQPRR